MSYRYLKTWRDKRKQEFINALGGQCCIQECGYNKCLDALDFHHLNGETKEYSISHLLSSPRRLELIVAEVSKCCILCSNHHRELHSGMIQLPEILPIFNIGCITIKRDKHKKCPWCSNTFEASVAKQIYCSSSCQHMAARKAHRPSVEILLKQVCDIGYVATGKLYGVTDNAIRKWIRIK